MIAMQKISPCLWFDNQAEDAAKFYVSIFDNSGIDAITRYGNEGFEIHKRPAGSVMLVAFHLHGLEFTALNGGPLFPFTEAISLQIFCETQDEVDRFWSKLTEGGGRGGQCGWLKDRFGLSWQLIGSPLPEMMRDPDTSKWQRVMKVVLGMTKPDIAALARAYEGK